jgi:hypothetical protein
MFKKVSILCAVILSASITLSYADSFTVNVPNAQGGYTALAIQTSGNGYTGPQGEFYASFPSVAQLQVVYGLDTPQQVVVTVPPPALPVYEQPEPPAPDNIWVPGYWSYDSFLEDYYWVPGTWVEAPQPGLYWTPGYWYCDNNHFIFRNGYWGDHVGFYGGINYGHGYEGRGYSGGNWNNNTFVQNRTANTININVSSNTVSYNGGQGGSNARPTSEEQSAMKEKHIPPTAVQTLNIQAARKDPVLRASQNHGKPAVAATVKPGVFNGNFVVPAKQAGAFYTGHPGTTAHPVTVAHPGTVQPKTNVQKPIVKKPVVKKPKPKPVVPLVNGTPPANGDNPQNKNPPGSN